MVTERLDMIPKLSPEAYRLQITPTQIIVGASNPAGFLCVAEFAPIMV